MLARSIRFPLALALGASALAFVPSRPSQGSAATPRPVPVTPSSAGNPGDANAAMIFFAVLEGLYEDGIPNEAVEVWLRKDRETGHYENFVYACPICSPALDALLLYRSRPKFYAMKGHPDTFGPGLTPTALARITGGDAATRSEEWGRRMQGWIERRLARLRLGPEERDAWRQTFEALRKVGNGLLDRYRAESRPGHYASMKRCPSCDAAADAK